MSCYYIYVVYIRRSASPAGYALEGCECVPQFINVFLAVDLLRLCIANIDVLVH